MSRKLFGLGFVVVFLAVGALAQSPAPAPAKPPSAAETRFLATADEVMAEVSKLLDLPVKAPLKKSMRTSEQIREYLLEQLRISKEKDKRNADQRALERFGLLPKGYDLEGQLVELLTEQVAGLYDPKSKEFYIVSGQSPMTLRMVLAHELVHALHDQHFEVEKWTDAAKPNDDAELARHTVLEGAATAAMIDYLLRDRPELRIRENPAFESVVRQLMGANISAESPQLAKAPPFIQDVLLFPYLSGAIFTQKILRERAGWKEYWDIFEKPPVSSQQILHPELYLHGVVPAVVVLPDISKSLGKGWQRLDENVMGEFGFHAVLKQHLDEQRADALAPAWRGDRYAIYEHSSTKQTVLAFRIRFEDDVNAARFLGQYGEALEKKHGSAQNLFRRPGFFSFEGGDGNVFLQCNAVECVTLEGAPREVFDKLMRTLNWPIAPRPSPAAQPAKRVARAEPANELDGFPRQPAGHSAPARPR